LLAILIAITIQCTRVAGRAFPNGKSLGRNRVIGIVLAWIKNIVLVLSETVLVLVIESRQS
jgi:hypothetical protein